MTAFGAWAGEADEMEESRYLLPGQQVGGAVLPKTENGDLRYLRTPLNHSCLLSPLLQRLPRTWILVGMSKFDE